MVGVAPKADDDLNAVRIRAVKIQEIAGCEKRKLRYCWLDFIIEIGSRWSRRRWNQ
jgi:hypothetical protein